jgi:excisionase family DNA binding protein
MAVNELDLLWGSKAIGAELGLSQRQVYWLLEAGRVPATKVGRRWCASRVILKQHFVLSSAPPRQSRGRSNDRI